MIDLDLKTLARAITDQLRVPDGLSLKLHIPHGAKPGPIQEHFRLELRFHATHATTVAWFFHIYILVPGSDPYGPSTIEYYDQELLERLQQHVDRLIKNRHSMIKELYQSPL